MRKFAMVAIYTPKNHQALAERIDGRDLEEYLRAQLIDKSDMRKHYIHICVHISYRGYDEEDLNTLYFIV